MSRSPKSRRLLAVAASVSLAGVASLGPPAGAAAPAASTFRFTGAPQRYVVPTGVCSVTVDAWGAQGGAGTISSWYAMVSGGHTIFIFPDAGGLGARSTSTLAVRPGESLQVNVGGAGDGAGIVDGGNQGFSTPDAGKGGWNGGADGGADPNQPAIGGGGGGASDVRQGGTGRVDRVVVAGGGGGTGAGSGISVPSPTGGVGGDPTTPGGDGSHQEVDVLGDGSGGGFADPISRGVGAGGGGGASAAAGGQGGTAGAEAVAVGTAGQAGSLGSGGVGASSTLAGDLSIGGYTGGGGGGGLYGGGGGGSAATVDPATPAPPGRLSRVVGAGGGGGSSLGTVTEPGVHEGAGQVSITPVAADCGHATPTSAPGATVRVAPVARVAKAVNAEPTYTG